MFVEEKVERAIKQFASKQKMAIQSDKYYDMVVASKSLEEFRLFPMTQLRRDQGNRLGT